ncbi:MAG: oligosaccharide flippase family protein [Oribacterium sp.]|nr:oligosaccharide flippase family protein [Oribacterium sp.]MBQ5330773.1 oligosaccharide flippase family protein [Oscillospiraceae bacterium]
MTKFKALLKKYNDIPVAAKATLWFMLCTIIQKGISLITTPIFTRIMTITQYGQFTIYNSWLQIFTILTTLRLNWAVFNKGMSKYKDDRDGYTSTMQSLTFIITAVWFVIYLSFHRAIDSLVELPMIIMVAIFAELFFTPAIDFWTLRKRYEYYYISVVVRTLLMSFLNVGIGVAAVLLSEEKGYARILSCVFVNLLFGIPLFITNRSKGKTWFKPEYARFALAFNLPLLLHYFSQYILDQFDKIMVQKMISIEAAGLYGVAYSAGLMMKIVTQSINNAIVPWQYEKLEKRQHKELDDVCFKIYILVAGCALVFCAFAPELMRILADRKYYEAVNVIPPVALGMVFSFMYTTFANVEFFYDQNKFTMYISMAGAALNIILNYFGIKIFGYVAAAYTTLFCYIVFALCHYIYMTKSTIKALNIENVYNGKRLLALSLITVLLGIILIFFYDKIVVRYCFIVVLLLVAFINRKKIQSILEIKASNKHSTD